MNYRDLMDAIKSEYKIKSEWSKEFDSLGKTKDKMKMLNMLIEKYNCDFDNALIIVEYFLDKKPLPNHLPTKEQILSQEEKYKESLNKPKCITCGSTNIKKISTSAKVAGAVAFGLFSKTAKSQFKCENCGCKW